MEYSPILYERQGCKIECFVTAKCGSSTLEELFYKRLPEFEFNHNVSKFRILVTRDPWNRLASFYSDKMVNRGYVKVTGNFRLGMESSGWSACGENIENASFTELVESLYNFKEPLEPHLQQQSDHMGINKDLIDKFDFIMKVESMEEDLKSLSRIIGFPSSVLEEISVGVSNKSNKSDISVADMSVEQHRANGGVPQNYESLYCLRTIEMVEKIYQKDIDIFGYTKESLCRLIK